MLLRRAEAFCVRDGGNESDAIRSAIWRSSRSPMTGEARAACAANTACFRGRHSYCMVALSQDEALLGVYFNTGFTRARVCAGTVSEICFFFTASAT